jgi:protoporphyrin/coproporphyrin ferrochelatase
MAAAAHDSVLLIAFGGPTTPAEVRPFLDNVLRGRPVPPQRLEAVVRHYELIGGRSPLNELTFLQARALEAALRARHLALPVYVGMRNWTPYFHETLQQMAAAGARRAVGLIMAAQQSEASWGRYRREIAAARAAVGAAAPAVDFAPEWHAHPLFIEAVADAVRTAVARLPAARRAAAALVFTAHSLPVAMAVESPYVEQVAQGARLVAERVGAARWSIAYQSRSGSPREPWLEPDVCDVLRRLGGEGAHDVVLVPIGFVCDHVEVLYDLDIEARQVGERLGLDVARAATVNDHPTFIRMLADVVQAGLGAAG